jgi:hypothetical protein
VEELPVIVEVELGKTSSISLPEVYDPDNDKY